MRKLTVSNRTEHTLSVEYYGPKQPHLNSCVILPEASTSLEVSSSKSHFVLSTDSSSKWSTYDDDEKVSVDADAFQTRFPLKFGAQWKAVKVEDGCPWRIYRSKTSRRHHRLLVLPKRNLASYLSELPDSVPLSSLALPGTHDSMALYGWPVSQCQDVTTPLPVQLQVGIRVLDIRLATKPEGLMAYHGVYPQHVSFQVILKTIHDFLTAPDTCRETIVMSIKQEDFVNVAPPVFSQKVRDEISGGPGGMEMFYLANKVPTLGEVRGKVVLFSRFGGDGNGWKDGLEGIGIHPTTWPDSKKNGFTWECKNTVVQTHDWYSIPSFLSIPEKVDLATRILLPPSNDLPTPTLSISFLSAASFPLGLPPLIARGFGWPSLGFGVEGVNSRVGSWLLTLLGEQEQPRVRGWVFMDFFRDPEDNAVVPLLVECNFRGRVGGQEGWPSIR
ncbi:hypothetical protein EIP91_001047 [Steccherinum ochraceum]|uniref:Phosphatidylinositol-specific phospholipase C X domain-containing protein n=1 Tax=Steccherinum ochraceum TaxID=92696 RepID=A0A4R0RIQ1_9APHY|nr:hypothetical protein EIP91_001047 [Steccherinum ochraceum]